MVKSYKLTGLDHIFNELYGILEEYLKDEDYYLLFSTPSGLIKGKWYPYNSVLNPDSEFWSKDFLENQELLVDKCLYETFCEKNHKDKNKDYELTLPDITYKDILCLKDVTLYQGKKEVHLPTYLLFTANITGFSLVDKNFKL